MIQITYDCPESLSNMTTNSGKGSPVENCQLFCQSCDKHIMDFRGKSRGEVEVLRKEHPEMSCGIFDPRQAQVDQVSTVRNVFRTAFLAVFIFGCTATSLFGQTIDSHEDTVRIEHQQAQSPSITGVVKNSRGKAVQATVAYTVKDEAGDVLHQYSFETDANGKFDFDLPTEVLGHFLSITIRLGKHYATYLYLEEVASEYYYFDVQMERAKKLQRRHLFGRRYVRGYY